VNYEHKKVVQKVVRLFMWYRRPKSNTVRRPKSNTVLYCTTKSSTSGRLMLKEKASR